MARSAHLHIIEKDRVRERMAQDVQANDPKDDTPHAASADERSRSSRASGVVSQGITVRSQSSDGNEDSSQSTERETFQNISRVDDEIYQDWSTDLETEASASEAENEASKDYRRNPKKLDYADEAEECEHKR